MFLFDPTLWSGAPHPAYIDPSTGFTITTLGGWVLASILGFFGLVPVFFKKFWRFFGKRGWIFLLVIGASAMIYGIMAFRNAQGPAVVPAGRIFVLGFDGLSPDIMEPLMAEGRLPHFEKLRKEGTYRKLRTTNPPQSPVAWSAFQTGQNPGKNGVYDFIVRDPSDYGLRLSLSNVANGRPRRVVRSKSFWQHLSDRKVPSVILGCPITFPPDAVRGRMLAGMGVPDALGTEGTFSYYTTDAAAAQGKDIGGNVFAVRPGDPVVAHLVGPKVASAGKPENVRVPMKIRVDAARRTAAVEFQGRRVELGERRWSDWQEVAFPLGFLRKMKGIFRFYLVEAAPHLRLYMSPVNFDPREPYFPIAHPAGYAGELADRIGLYYTAGMPLDTWAVNEGRLDEEAFIDQVNLVFDERNRMLDLELERFREGLFFFYLEDPDIVQHMFWRYIDPQNPMHEAGAPERHRTFIRDWYVKVDGVLGKVMRKVGPGDTLLVLSDHGMGPFRRAVHLNSWLRHHGYLRLTDDSAPAGGELFAGVDWPRTRAYAMGFGAVYLNLRGRERDGLVEPGPQAEALAKEISEKLKGWVDAETGASPVRAVYPREAIFQGPYAAETPDLYVGFNAGYRASWQTAVGGAPAALVEDNRRKWAGDHLFDPELVPGVLFSNRPLAKDDPSLYDLAPTVLRLAGFSDAELAALDLDGSPLTPAP